MKVFPISIMGVNVLSQVKNNFEQIQDKTLALINEAKEAGQQYFVINFHDNYFSDLYTDHKMWFTWLVEYFVKQGYEFTDFYAALSEVKG